MLTLEKCLLDVHVLAGAEDWKQPTCPPARAARRFGVLVTVPVKRGKETNPHPELSARVSGSRLQGIQCRLHGTSETESGPLFSRCPVSVTQRPMFTALACGRRTCQKSGQGVPAGPATRALAPLLVRAAKPSLQSASHFCVRVTFPPSAGGAQGQKVASAAWCLPLRRVISEVRVIRSILSLTHVGLDLSWCPGLPHSSKNARVQGWAVVWCPGSCFSVTQVSGPRGSGCPPPLARALS